MLLNFSYSYLLRLFLLFSSIFSSSLLANSAASGKALYQQCAVCHGSAGEGNEQLNAPALAGQFDWYISRQLNNFSIALRGAHKDDIHGKQMASIAKGLTSESDVLLLSQFIKSFPKPVVNTKSRAQIDANSLKNGSRYYHAKCGACHGGEGQGNKAFNAPKLNMLDTGYLLRQMNNFSTGIRGTEKADKLGRQMAMMAKTTSGQELKDIVYYLSTMKNSDVK